MSESSPPRAADRNLLFGILALQMDFITRDALIKAMHAWVLEKAKPLGLILREQAALAADEHALLEALVAKHLAKHAGDPQQSLAAVSSVGSLRQELEQVADSDLHASLAHVSAAAKEKDPYATEPPPSVGTPTSSGLRFRILRPHAKGGLGQVYVAVDEELHREVALKEIQGKHADHPESRARFLLEAEVTGGLEHPGIVPVYGLGQYDDGRRFYAMRFIRGDSLKDGIEQFHKAEAPGCEPTERTLALRALLGRFVDVCNAIAYAHARGVLRLVSGAVRLEGEPGRVVLAVLRPQMGKGVSGAQVQGAAKPVPAEPIGRLHQGALGVGDQPLVFRFREAEPVEADLDAVMVAHAADRPLGQPGCEAVREVRHRDGFPAWHHLAEVAGPEVADPQSVLQEGGDGIPSAMRVGGGPGVGAEERQDIPLCGLNDATRPQALTRQTQFLGQLAFADKDPDLVPAR
jgi:hypothetical protein